MPKLHHIKTSFTSGIISPSLYGRGDLKAYINGAARLDNVYLQATGGLTRRNGTRFLYDFGQDDDLQYARLCPFMFNADQIYILCFRHHAIDVFLHDAWLCSVENSPYQAEDLSGLRFTMSADTMLIVHQDYPIQKLVRKAEEEWEISTLGFYEKDGLVHQPYYKFADEGVTLTPSATSGNITLTASQEIFSDEHINTRFRLEGKQVKITAILDAKQVKASCQETLNNSNATEDWEEQSFSPYRGYPNSICFHQDRLFLGGSRDLPNRIWASKSADFYNFDLGEGLDDEAIELALVADQVNRVEALFSATELQIYTSGAEWVLEGEPITPAEAYLFRSTRSGTKPDPHIAPCYVDGAVLFAARGAYDKAQDPICEFVYAESQQSFLATDLTVLCPDLTASPIDQTYDPVNRCLYVVQSGGDMALLTLFRAENVMGWTRMTTKGDYLSIANLHDWVYLLVKRENGYFLERIDRELYCDATLQQAHDETVEHLQGLDIHEGEWVQLCLDHVYMGDFQVKDGIITLPQPLKGTFTLGLSYETHIEPLPLSIENPSTNSQMQAMRLLRLTLRLLDSDGLELDTGQGYESHNLLTIGQDRYDETLPLYTGDYHVQVMGWQHYQMQPLWRIRLSRPLPLTLLSVTQQIAAYSR